MYGLGQYFKESTHLRPRKGLQAMSDRVYDFGDGGFADVEGDRYQ